MKRTTDKDKAEVAEVAEKINRLKKLIENEISERRLYYERIKTAKARRMAFLAELENEIYYHDDSILEEGD